MYVKNWIGRVFSKLRLCGTANPAHVRGRDEGISPNLQHMRVLNFRLNRAQEASCCNARW